MVSSRRKKFKEEPGRWVAIKSQEFGWLAGWIKETTDSKIIVRIEKRRLNGTPSIVNFQGWDDITPTVTTFFKESKSYPRIIPMGIKRANLAL